ncbi:MAG TPA: glycosyltransferase family 2 protein [Anaerolineae bacterium]|nr:glycosyltransferase family 2 protein [Anaerolineae bacterium]
MNPPVSIILLNWNGLRYLPACLAAIHSQTYTDFEVILVDNGSTDGSIAWLKERFPEVRLICNEKNRGFAEANNQAIRTSQASYIVTLNNDTRVDPGWLAALVAAADGSPQVGMCASKMVFADRPDMINSTGISLDPVGIAWDRRGGEPDDDCEAEPVEVFGPCAGAALYRRAMLEQIGLFDEDFFAYLEDVDLAWRARLAGWRCLYIPAARVYHIHSATAIEGSAFKHRLLGRNKVWLIAKNYPLPRLLFYLPLIVIYDLAAVLFTLVKRQDISSLQGRLEGLRALRRMWRKRRTVQALRRTSVSRGKPWQYYLSPMVFPWQAPSRYKHLSKKSFDDIPG